MNVQPASSGTTASVSRLRAELRPMLRLVMPLVLAELGWMAMGIVDTMMVGRLPQSADAIGAVSLGSNIFFLLAFMGEGMLLGLDTLVAQAFGAGRREDCHRSLVHGIYLSIALTPLLGEPVWLLPRILGGMGIDAAVLRLAILYAKILAVGLFPLLLYFALRRCLQAMDIVKPVAFALVSANVVNALGNWILIYGKWGAPAMGIAGSAWSTAISRLYMAGALAAYLLWYDRRHRTQLLRTPVNIELARIRRLLALGIPAALQVTMEGGVFVVATALIAKLGAVPLASHQIALMTVALTYMVPLGISSATAVRVGQGIGRGNLFAAATSGYTGIGIGAAFMSCSALTLVLIPRAIARIYTPDELIIQTSVLLLAAGAAFQLFDGIQTVATGALRGAGDTRTPMFCHFAAYWLIGFPLGAWLCFRRGWGAFGIWSGLSLALILIGTILLLAWRRTARRMALHPSAFVIAKTVS